MGGGCHGIDATPCPSLGLSLPIGSHGPIAFLKLSHVSSHTGKNRPFNVPAELAAGNCTNQPVVNGLIEPDLNTPAHRLPRNHSVLPYRIVPKAFHVYPSVPTDSQSQIMQPTIASRARSTEPESPIHFVQQDSSEHLQGFPHHEVTALKGMFGKPARVVSIEEMNEAIRTCGAAAR